MKKRVDNNAIGEEVKQSLYHVIKENQGFLEGLKYKLIKYRFEYPTIENILSNYLNLSSAKNLACANQYYVCAYDISGSIIFLKDTDQENCEKDFFLARKYLSSLNNSNARKKDI